MVSIASIKPASLMHRQLWRSLRAFPFHGGDRVLEMGLSGGTDRARYPINTTVTAVEIMVDSNANHTTDSGEGIVAVDPGALKLPFADESFDLVVLPHVISVVPDPQKCLVEAIRVTADRGIIMIVNHFKSKHQPMAWIETAVNPLCNWLGWRSDLSLIKLLRRACVSNADRLYLTEGRFFRTVYLQKLRKRARLIAAPHRDQEGVWRRGPLVLGLDRGSQANAKQYSESA